MASKKQPAKPVGKPMGKPFKAPNGMWFRTYKVWVKTDPKTGKTTVHSGPGPGRVEMWQNYMVPRPVKPKGPHKKNRLPPKKKNNRRR